MTKTKPPASHEERLAVLDRYWTPGTLHEGGELGYALSHTYVVALDDPELVVACVIGDSEAETGPLAASWLSHAFIEPATSDSVLPILHLNDYKLSRPTVLSALGMALDLTRRGRGYSYSPNIIFS